MVKIKRAAANAPLLNPRALSTSTPSTPSTTKLTPSSTNPTSPAFMLIQEISHSDNESQPAEDSQKQGTDEETLNFLAQSMVSRGGPPHI